MPSHHWAAWMLRLSSRTEVHAWWTHLDSQAGSKFKDEIPWFWYLLRTNYLLANEHKYDVLNWPHSCRLWQAQAVGSSPWSRQRLYRWCSDHQTTPLDGEATFPGLDKFLPSLSFPSPAMCKIIHEVKSVSLFYFRIPKMSRPILASLSEASLTSIISYTPNTLTSNQIHKTHLYKNKFNSKHKQKSNHFIPVTKLA